MSLICDALRMPINPTTKVMSATTRKAPMRRGPTLILLNMVGLLFK